MELSLPRGTIRSRIDFAVADCRMTCTGCSGSRFRCSSKKGDFAW